MLPAIAFPGRGCWTRDGGTTPFYQNGVGQQSLNDCLSFSQVAVCYGVATIKKRVNAVLGTSTLTPTNYFYGFSTASEVAKAQKILNVTADGVVGPQTARALLVPLVKTAEANHHIPDHLLCATMDLESNFDPGGQGDGTPFDLGLEQINTKVYPVPVAQAFDHEWAIADMAARMRSAFNKYVPDPSKPWQTQELRYNCTVAAHYAPGWADLWWNTGTAPASGTSVSVAEYAHAVMARVPNFK
jgi:hypothetical protein